MAQTSIIQKDLLKPVLKQESQRNLPGLLPIWIPSRSRIRPVGESGYYDLSLAGKLAEGEDVIKFEGQDVADLSKAIAILGKEADFRKVETILGSDAHLIEVKCVNRTLVFD